MNARHNPEKHSPWLDDLERAMWFAGGVFIGARRPVFSPWMLALGAFGMALFFFRVMPYVYRLTGKIPYFRNARQP